MRTVGGRVQRPPPESTAARGRCTGSGTARSPMPLSRAPSTPLPMALSGHTPTRSLARYGLVSAEALQRWQQERDPGRRRTRGAAKISPKPAIGDVLPAQQGASHRAVGPPKVETRASEKTRSLKPTPRSDFREPGAFGPKNLVNGFREQTASLAARPGAEDGRWPRRTARPTHCGFRAYFGRTPVRPDRGNGPAGLGRRSSGRGMSGQAATPVACLWLSSLLVARHAGQQGDAGSAITPPPSGQPARTAARRTSR